VGDSSDLFAAVDRKWKIFRRKDTESTAAIPVPLLLAGANADTYLGQANETGPKPFPRLTNKELAERTLLDTYGASGVLINEKADILFFHGPTSKYLQPPEGEAHFNALAMAREDLKSELANIIRKGLSRKKLVRQDNLRIQSGEESFVNLIVIPILEPPSKRGLFMLIFEEAKPPSRESDATDTTGSAAKVSTARVSELEHQLASTKEYLQTTIEELETSNEELKSTNEELQSANEELQSTNEELETCKEEQQSVNEELVTVNSELQQKVDALAKANDNMNNLLAATQIGTVFLDTNINIQRFTPQVQKVINIIDGDVGRPLSHIVHNLEYDHLVEDAKRALQSLSLKETEVRTKDGSWYSVRVLPYRTVQNVIEGVVITFVDISDRKHAEIKAKENEQRYRTIGDLFAGVWTCTPDGKMTYLSQSFLDMMGLTLKECEGHRWIKKMQIDDVDKLLAEWKGCIQNGNSWSHTFSVPDKFGNKRRILTRGMPVRNDQGEVTSWVGINLDIEEAVKAAKPSSVGSRAKKRSR
jgi:two-component system CheB/CheR fusion protein